MKLMDKVKKKSKNLDTKGKKEEAKDVMEEQGLRPMAITVKIVVLNSNHKILLLKRSKESLNAEKWDLPGGWIDKGETIEEAIKREAIEETGLSVEVGPIINAVEFPKEHEAFASEKRGLRYIALTTGTEVKLNEEEHSEFKWVSFDEALEMLEDKGFEAEKKQTIMEAKNRMELEKSLDGWHRTLADFENFKKRTEKSNDEFRRFCLENLILEILPVIDNFEMATKHIPKEQQNEGWVVGVMHIKNQLLGVLENNGVTEIPTREGDKINELIHEVIKSEKKDVDGDEIIKNILKKGYQIGEKVIRPAAVEVG
jgi:molecular chaperone GrpE